MGGSIKANNLTEFCAFLRSLADRLEAARWKPLDIVTLRGLATEAERTGEIPDVVATGRHMMAMFAAFPPVGGEHGR